MSFFGSPGVSLFGNASVSTIPAQIGPDLEEIETEALSFQAIEGESKLRLLPSSWPTSALPPSSASLLSIAPRKGLVAAAGPDSVVIASTESVRQAFSAPSVGEDKVKPFVPLFTLDLGMRVSQVAFSADENFLVISAESGGGLGVYGVQTLMEGNTQRIFELSTNGTSLRSIAPNPTSEKAELIALVTANGELKMANLNSHVFVNGRQGENLKDGVSCVSWSNRGKQLVAGLGNGACVQMTPEGEIKAEIPRPGNTQVDQYVSSISWLDNNTFLVAYTPSAFGPGTTPSTTFHIVTRQTQPQVSFIFQKLPELCPSFGTTRLPPYSFLQRLKDFPPSLQDLIVVISTAAPDVSLISRSNVALTHGNSVDKVTNVFTTTTIANDARRAQLPMSADMTETTAIGVALDLSGKEKVRRPLPGEEIEETHGPLPGLMVLNNEGILSFWWLVYADSIRQGTTYPGLVLGSPQGQGQPQITQQGAFPGTISNPPTAFNQPFGGTSSLAGTAGTPFGKPAAPALWATSTAGSGGFGTTSALGKQQSPWASNTSAAQSSSPAFGQPAFGQPAFGQPAFGQPSFGAPSTMGAMSQGAAFGITGNIGNRVSPWAKSASGQAGVLGTGSGSPSAGGLGSSTFGSTASIPTSGGFASFAKAPGFAAAAAQGGGEGGFSKGSPAASFGTGMDTDTSFSGIPKKENDSSSPFKSNGFVLGSTFKGDGTAANDLPKPPTDGSNSLFGISFGENLEQTKKAASTPPTREAEMDDTISDDGRSSPVSATGQESTPVASPNVPRFESHTTAPPLNGGFFGTQAQSSDTPASVQASAPATFNIDKSMPTTTTPTETPRKSEIPRPSNETTPTPLIKRDLGDIEPATLQGLSKNLSERSLPPEPTSKASYTPGDTSSSSIDTQLASDSKPSRKKASLPQEPLQNNPQPPALDEDDELEDDEGSGVDVAQEISPTTDPSQSPKITPGSSFGASFDRSPLGGLFTKVTQQQNRQSKPLFGEVGQAPLPYFPQPAKLSPRSPSPVRPLLTGDRLRPDNVRSVSAPDHPPKSTRKIALSQLAVGSPTRLSLEDERKLRDQLTAQNAQKTADEEVYLSDREDEKVREELETEVEATKDLEPFLAHQDYVGSVSKPGVPGQIETVYRDINSMLDTLGLNARSLKAFTKGHSDLYQEGGRSREDLETEDWCLIEISDLGAVESQLLEKLEEGRMQSIQEKLDTCREYKKDLEKIRSKRHEIAKFVDTKSDPEQIEAKRSAPLDPEQNHMQHDLRRNFSRFQMVLADAEEKISILRARLASSGTNSGESAPFKKPTVEAVTSTIKKMTSMVEKKTLDIDLLEAEIRRLRLSSVNGSNSRESSPFVPSSTLRSSTSRTLGEPNDIPHKSSSMLKRSRGENGSPGKRLSIVTDQDMKRYRTKIERRKEINTVIKKAFLDSGPRIRSLD